MHFEQVLKGSLGTEYVSVGDFLAIVLTSVNSVMPNLKPWFEFAQASSLDCQIYVAADTKSPPAPTEHIDNLVFLDMEAQDRLCTDLSLAIGWNTYARKNLAYLAAIRDGATIIWDTDDDTFPIPDIPGGLPVCATKKVISEGFVNPYPLFGYDHGVYPRGLPLSKVLHPDRLVQSELHAPVFPDIIQGLVDGEPDRDAIQRLILGPPPSLAKPKRGTYLVERGWLPGNTQATLWPVTNAFLWLLVPHGLSFRSSDIWKMYVAQTFLSIAVTSPFSYQIRNEHDLLTDFESEIPNFLHVESLVSLLEEIPAGSDIVDVYEQLALNGLVTRDDVTLARLWQQELQKLR